MTLNEYMLLQKGMNSTRNHKIWGIFLNFTLNCLNYIKLTKQNIRFMTYIEIKCMRVIVQKT